MKNITVNDSVELKEITEPKEVGIMKAVVRVSFVFAIIAMLIGAAFASWKKQSYDEYMAEYNKSITLEYLQMLEFEGNLAQDKLDVSTKEKNWEEVTRLGTKLLDLQKRIGRIKSGEVVLEVQELFGVGLETPKQKPLGEL